MIKFQHLLLNKDDLIKDAMKKINDGACKIALIVDEEMYLLGTISDGDIRRALLDGSNINDKITNVFCKQPIVSTPNTSMPELVKLAKKNKILRIPVVDVKGKLLSVDKLGEIISPASKPNKVVLMVGGLGTRLKPLTDNIPKPMLEVGGRPILETIIKKFVSNGFSNIVLCVNYKHEVIQDYFGTGESFGASIEYVHENKRMGTAGALTLLKEQPDSPFFVMNGDLLTDVNFESLKDYHEMNTSVATMCVRKYDFQVPFGVVSLNGNSISEIKEKPVHRFFVSAGIYMLDPKCLNLIPKDEFYDMPTLFDKLISLDEKAISFPLSEYWLDIGRIEEYEKANVEYHGVFS